MHKWKAKTKPNSKQMIQNLIDLFDDTHAVWFVKS